VALVLSVIALIRRRSWPVALAALLVGLTSLVLIYRPELVRDCLGL